VRRTGAVPHTPGEDNPPIRRVWIDLQTVRQAFQPWLKASRILDAGVRDPSISRTRFPSAR
jgi:hypothetical protein